MLIIDIVPRIAIKETKKKEMKKQFKVILHPNQWMNDIDYLSVDKFKKSFFDF